MADPQDETAQPEEALEGANTEAAAQGDAPAATAVATQVRSDSGNRSDPAVLFRCLA